MSTLLWIGLMNAVLAGLLAVLVALLGRYCRRPALLHGLWLLVLVKLITPSFLPVPVPGWLAEPDRTAPAPEVVADGASQSAETALPSPVDSGAPAGRSEARVPRLPPLGGRPAPAPATAPQAGTPLPPPDLPQPVIKGGGADTSETVCVKDAEPELATASIPIGAWLPGVLFSVWLGGASWCFFLAALRISRFGRLLGCAEPAPAALQAEAEWLARRVGLGRCPRVWLVPGPLPPLVWAVGRRAGLFLPARLLERLDQAGCAALLVHELAHVRRRDHWVRWLELVVLALYWWYPLAWWARQRLQAAEEECCDAWVVSELPGAARSYAAALLDTIDFLAETRACLAPAASGFGRAHFMKRRLRLIVQASTPRGLSWAGPLILLPLAFGFLPLLPAPSQPPAILPDDPADADDEGDLEQLFSQPTPDGSRGRILVPAALPDNEESPEGTGPGGQAVHTGPLPRQVARHTQLLASGRLTAATLSPDGKVAAVAGSDHGIRLYETRTWQVMATLIGHRSAVTALSFSPDGKLLASASRDRTARVWDMTSWQQLAALKGHRGSVLAVAFSRDGQMLATGGSDRAVLLWDVPVSSSSWPGRERLNLPDHEAAVTCLDFSSRDRFLAAGTEQGAGGKGIVRLWDPVSGEPLTAWEAHAGGLTALAFEPEANRLASAGSDGALRIWDAEEEGRLLLTRRRRAAHSLVWSSDGKRLISGHAGGAVVLWETSTWLEVGRLSGHRARVGLAAFAAGDTAISADADGVLKRWDLRPRKYGVVRGVGHQRSVTAVAMTPDGGQVLSAGSDGTLRIWQAATGKEIASWDAGMGQINAVALSPDGKRAVTAGDDGTARLWDVAGRRELRRLEGNGVPVTCVALSPDGSYALTGEREGEARLWEAATGVTMKRFPRVVSGKLHALTFSPDGQSFVAGGGRGSCVVWDVSGQERLRLKGLKGSVLSVAFAPNGDRILTSDDSTARLWDAASGKELRCLKGHERIVRQVVFTPSGEHALTASADCTVRRWDLGTGECRDSFQMHGKPVLCVSVSADGRRALSGGDDGALCIWDLPGNDEAAP
jgi:WD40 repeat protein/beta-lactamase regulating signal transducer with metallopeptidase domain